MADQEASFFLQKDQDQVDNTMDSPKKRKINSNHSLLNFTSSVLDDIDRVDDTNTIVENTVQTLCNLSSDHTQHRELIDNGIFKLIQKFLADLRYFAKTTLGKHAGIDFKDLSNGTVSVFKAFIKILLNISENAEVHAACTESDMIDLLLESMDLNDYEIQTGLYQTIGNILTSPDAEVRKLMVRRRLLHLVIETQEQSRFYKIKRICGEYLGMVLDRYPSMFELNEIYHKKRIPKSRTSVLNSDLGIISN